MAVSVYQPTTLDQPEISQQLFDSLPFICLSANAVLLLATMYHLEREEGQCELWNVKLAYGRTTGLTINHLHMKRKEKTAETDNSQ